MLGAGGGSPEVDIDTDKPFLITGVTDVTQIAQLTGPDAINDTESVAVAGTDLGSMFDVRTTARYFVFGDTFGIRDPTMTGAAAATGARTRWRTRPTTTRPTPSRSTSGCR